MLNHSRVQELPYGEQSLHLTIYMFTVNKFHIGKIIKLHRTSVAAFSETQASPVIIKWSSQSTAHWLFYCYQYKNVIVINAVHFGK